MLRRSTLALLAALPTFAISTQVRAQSAVPLQGVLWNPSVSVDPDALPHVEGTRLPGPWNWNAGLAVQILDRPYALRTGSSYTSLVSHQLWTNLLFQVGLGQRFAAAVELPVLLSQSSDLSPLGQSDAGSVGFGDVRGVLRWSSRAHLSSPSPRTVNSPSNRGIENTQVNEGPGVGVQLAVSGPTGEARSFTGAGAWIVHPAITGDFRLFGLMLVGQVGYRARLDGYWPSQGSTCEGTSTPTAADVSCLANVPLRDAVTFSAGLRVPSMLLGYLWRPLANVASPFVEVVGSFDARNPGAAGTTPVELGGGLQHVFGDITATISGAGGLSDAPGLPRFRGMLVIQWAPRFIDEDNDGLRDNTGEDQCVGLPEDLDGFQDNDGCPEDNDQDDIPDAEDRCPNENEDVDGFQDEDGCPDPDNDQDGILDAEDECPNVAQGTDPDSHRHGCPANDDDHDGVLNAQDQCPTVAAGDHPDPARPGCPAPDTDHDGVPDDVDACPHEAGGEHGEAGCPDLDSDHDGVLNDDDRCPTTAETINGVQDDDGCPEVPAPPGAHVRVRIVGASATSPGDPELLEAIHFTAQDHVDPASEPALAQLALALVATTRRPSRTHGITVMLTPASVRGPRAIDAARAIRRRDAVLAILRAHGAPAWAAHASDPIPAHPVRNDRGIVITTEQTVAVHAASASPAPSASPSPAPSASPRP